MQRYLRYFLGPVVAVVGTAAALSAWFQPVSGDLTRIGAFSERDFGWNEAQPVLRLAANGKSLASPAVLVLGDSFSEHNVWQSELGSRIDAPVLTFLYGQSGCVRNWLDYALAQPTAKFVVVESVEREFIRRFSALTPCGVAQPAPLELPAGETAAARATWPPGLHLQHTFRTAFNTLAMNMNGRTLDTGKVVSAPLTPGCARFSNRRADRLLYYAEDNAKLQWTAQQVGMAAANLKRAQGEFAARGKQLVFVLIPDKSSAYRDCLADDRDSVARKRVNPTQALIAAGVATPDLMRAFQANVGRVVDLYLPDDTHLSAAGYRLMAGEIAPLLAEKPGVATNASSARQ